MENECVFKEALQGPVFSPWGRQVWNNSYKNIVSNLSKGTDNSEAFCLMLEEEIASGTL